MQFLVGHEAQEPGDPPALPLVACSPRATEPSSVLSVESLSASEWSVSRAKRSFDLVAAILALSLLALPMAAIAILVRLTSAGPAIFVQKRVGRDGRLFSIYKFRTMIRRSKESAGPGLTRDGDDRITLLGRILRKFKLDELPQFYNILRGDMSLIGPRPKLPKYAAIRNMPFRPGITGAATLAFRREEEALRQVHPALLDDFYNRHIRPVKAGIDLSYMARATFWSDMSILASTFLSCFVPSADPSIPLVSEGRADSKSGLKSFPSLEKDRVCEEN